MKSLDDPNTPYPFDVAEMRRFDRLYTRQRVAFACRLLARS